GPSNTSAGGAGGATSSAATTSTSAQGSSSAAASSSSGGGSGGGATKGPLDLCKGLVLDKEDHAMTALAQPALGQTAVDAQFGTTIRRITAVAKDPGGADSAIIPLYSTVSAWNADESRLMLLQVNKGQALYDGKTYAFIKDLDINPADVEQVYWD